MVAPEYTQAGDEGSIVKAQCINEIILLEVHEKDTHSLSDERVVGFVSHVGVSLWILSQMEHSAPVSLEPQKHLKKIAQTV